MSNLNTISFLLGFKDKNIIPDENFQDTAIVRNNITHKVIHMKTTTDFVLCPHCGLIASKLHDYRTVNLKHSTGEKQPLIIALRKKRFKCMHCGSIVTEQLQDIQKNCFITDETKRSLIVSLKKTCSLVSVAENHNVSYSCVYRALEKVNYHSAPKSLPEVLSFDEFKADTNEGKYAFMAVDPINRNIIEILCDRKYSTVYKFFASYSKKERKKVRFIISDLWKPYRKIAKVLFPNATFVADKFHYQRLVSNAFNQIRKNTCKKLDETKSRQIKKYWKLLNKKECALDVKEKFYCHWLKRPVTQKQLVDELLSLDASLKEAWQLYQDFLSLIGLDDPKLQQTLLNSWLERAMNSGLELMKNAAKSLTNWKDAVIASFSKYNGRQLSNGTIEGINNRIKVIKRVSYGYRSFINFKKRILLIFY